MLQWWQRSWAVAVSGALVATVTVLCFARCRSAEREEWQRLRKRAAAISAPFARGVEAHAPLLGSAQPGFADRHYRAATEQFGPTDPVGDEPHLHDLLAMAELPRETEARLTRHQAALTELAAGAAADQIDYRTFRDSLGSEQPEGTPLVVVGVTSVGTAALVAARHDLAGGRHANAVQRAADVLTLARDQLGAGVGLYDLVATALVCGTCELWREERLRTLPAAEQRRLAEALLRFDVTCGPATSCAAGEAAHHVAIAELRPELRGDPEQLDAYLSAVAALPADNAPWSARQPALAAASTCLPDSHRSRLAHIELARREAIARVRLLRMAVAHHLGEPLPVLLDPFSEAPLQTSEHEGGRRLSSGGKDANGKPIERFVRPR